MAKTFVLAAVTGWVFIATVASCGPKSSGPGNPASNLVSPPAAKLADGDFDGVSNSAEHLVGTNPTAIDSDRDGLTDHYELWGVTGFPVGSEGTLVGLPDPNGNGVIAALDAADAGLLVLGPREVSAAGTARMVVPPYNAGAQPTPADPDGDLVPSDYELAGFYIEYDPTDGQLYFVKWDGQDYSKAYYKTDPLKWSTDADPWSDYEEATKINLDQRIKKPGDHPLVPAYPDLQVLLQDFTWEQNEDITDADGRKASTTLTGGLKLNWKNSVEISGEVAAKAGVLEWGEAKFGAKFTHESGGEISVEAAKSEEVEWTTTTASNTIKTAKLTLNASLINVGTLPATNPNLTCNLRLGGFIVTTFHINYTGSLQAISAPVPLAITNDGAATPQDLYLSLNQLKSLMRGGDLTVEVVGFEADTLVGVLDSATGRRINLNIDKWSPYQAAIQNNTARLVVDLDTGEGPIVAPNGLPKRRMADARVFAFDPDATYFGSPPVVTLRDGLSWVCNAREALGNTFITITDCVSGEPFTASLKNWNVTLYPDDAALVSNSPELQADLLGLPLKPSNPQERAYFANAPGVPGTFDTEINWATFFAFERTLLAAISNDRHAISAVMLPRPGGTRLELTPPGAEPGDTDDDSLTLFSLSVPRGYRWTGYETLEVTDVAGETLSYPVELYRNIQLPDAGKTPFFEDSSVDTLPAAGSLDLDLAFTDPSAVADLRLSRPDGLPDGDLFVEALNGAAITGIWADAPRFPLSGQLTDNDIYDWLRKTDINQESILLPSRIAGGAYYTGTYALGVETSEGRLALVVFKDFDGPSFLGTGPARHDYQVFDGV
jgi:hypothetical protein